MCSYAVVLVTLFFLFLNVVHMQMHPEGAPPLPPLYHHFRRPQIGSMVLTQVGAKVVWGEGGWGWGRRGRRQQFGEKRPTVISPVMISLLPLVPVCICMYGYRWCRCVYVYVATGVVYVATGVYMYMWLPVVPVCYVCVREETDSELPCLGFRV